MFIFKGKRKRSSVRTKSIGIPKCDLFFRYHHAKEILIYYFHDTKLCTKHEKTREFHSYYWDHICKVNESYLVNCFHREFRASTQIMVRNYCIAKCSRLLVALRANFFRNLKYLNSNPGGVHNFFKEINERRVRNLFPSCRMLKNG